MMDANRRLAAALGGVTVLALAVIVGALWRRTPVRIEPHLSGAFTRVDVFQQPARLYFRPNMAAVGQERRPGEAPFVPGNSDIAGIELSRGALVAGSCSALPLDVKWQPEFWTRGVFHLPNDDHLVLVKVNGIAVLDADLNVLKSVHVDELTPAGNEGELHRPVEVMGGAVRCGLGYGEPGAGKLPRWHGGLPNVKHIVWTFDVDAPDEGARSNLWKQPRRLSTGTIQAADGCVYSVDGTGAKVFRKRGSEPAEIVFDTGSGGSAEISELTASPDGCLIAFTYYVDYSPKPGWFSRSPSLEEPVTAEDVDCGTIVLDVQTVCYMSLPHLSDIILLNSEVPWPASSGSGDD